MTASFRFSNLIEKVSFAFHNRNGNAIGELDHYVVPRVEQQVYRSVGRLSLVLTSAIVLTLLSACQLMGLSSGPTNTDSFCLIALPISWSPKDTDQTLEQVKEHNAIGKRLCGWGKSKSQ